MIQTNGAYTGVGDRTTSHDDVKRHGERREMIALCNLYIADPLTVYPSPFVVRKEIPPYSCPGEKPLEADLKPAKQPVANGQNTICPMITLVYYCDLNKLRTQKTVDERHASIRPCLQPHLRDPERP